MKTKAQCKCGKRFKVSTRLVGRPIRCPFCLEKFILPDPDLPVLPALSNDNDPLRLDTEVPALEGLESAGLDSAGLDRAGADLRPPEGIDAGLSGKELAAAPRKWFGWAFTGGVAATALIGIGLLVFFVMSVMNSGRAGIFGQWSNSIDLGYLPANIYRLEYLNVSDFAASPAGQEILASDSELAATVELAHLITGLSLQDIESVTLAHLDPNAPRNQPDAFGWEVRGSFAFCGVVRTKVPFEQERVLEFAGQSAETEHQGKAYFTVERQHRMPVEITTAIYFPDDTTIVFGTVDEVQAAISSKGIAPRQKVFDVIRRDDTVALIIDGRASEGMVHSQCAQVGQDIRIRESIDCGSAAAAKDHHLSNEEAVSNAQQLHQLFESFNHGMFPAEDADEDSDEESQDAAARSERFDIPFRVEGRKLVREMRLTRPDEYLGSFVLTVIRDVLPIHGEQ